MCLTQSKPATPSAEHIVIATDGACHVPKRLGGWGG